MRTPPGRDEFAVTVVTAFVIGGAHGTGVHAVGPDDRVDQRRLPDAGRAEYHRGAAQLLAQSVEAVTGDRADLQHFDAGDLCCEVGRGDGGITVERSALVSSTTGVAPSSQASAMRRSTFDGRSLAVNAVATTTVSTLATSACRREVRSEEAR